MIDRYVINILISSIAGILFVACSQGPSKNDIKRMIAEDLKKGHIPIVGTNHLSGKSGFNPYQPGSRTNVQVDLIEIIKMASSMPGCVKVKIQGRYVFNQGTNFRNEPMPDEQVSFDGITGYHIGHDTYGEWRVKSGLMAAEC